jgi:uncharacterized membrane protein
MANDVHKTSGDPVAGYFAPGGDNVKLVYILYLASIIVGITVFVGVILAYINRGQAAGTWAESHYTYQIRTFWIGILYSLISVALMVVLIGFLLIVVVFIWFVVRCVRGLQWSSAGQPVANPKSWMI